MRRRAPGLEAGAKTEGETDGEGTTVAKLPTPTRKRMRKTFGSGVEGVELHEGGKAGRIAGHRAAATIGNRVFFRRGQLQPATLPGQALLAHELAHATQQRSGVGPNSGPAHEGEADSAAMAALLGERHPPTRSAGLSLAGCGSSYDVNSAANRERVDRLARLFRRQQRALDRGANQDELDAIERELEREYAGLPPGIVGNAERLRELRRRVLEASDAGGDASDPPPAARAPFQTLDLRIRVLQTMPYSREELRVQVSQAVDDARPVWEDQQPLQVEDQATRDARWGVWRDRRIARAMGDEPAAVVRPVDLRQTDLVSYPASGRMLLVYGAAGIGIASASNRGILQPASQQGSVPIGEPPRPTPRPVNRPGPTGPTPAHARPASPMLGVPGIGKEGLMLANLGGGQGLLIDAGGTQAVMPLEQVRLLAAEMGIGSIQSIAITHPHADHVRQLRQLILANNIRVENLRVSGAFRNSSALQALLTTSNADMIRLGYVPGARFGELPVPARGAAGGSVRLASGHRLRFLGDGTATRASATGGTNADAASSMFLIEGPQTRANRAFVLQDVRGQNISALRAQLGPEGFGRALDGVRLIKGFGHHFGLAAGHQHGHVPGMNELIRTAIARNGSLTIVVQTTEANSLRGGTSPLLEYARGLGARVILVTDVSQVTINDRMQVNVRGPGVRVFRGNRVARQAAQRIGELNQAIAEVQARGQLAVRELGLGDRPPNEVTSALTAERDRLVRLHGELADRLGIQMVNSELAARGRAPLGERATANMLIDETLPNDARGRPGRRPMPRDARQIQTELNRTGGPPLSDKARVALRRAAGLGSSLAVEAELGTTPRAVADAVRSGSRSRLITDIEGRYQRLGQLGGDGTTAQLSPEARLQAVAEVEGLISDLGKRRGQVAAGPRAELDSEILRLRGVRESLMAEVQVRTTQSRGSDGTLRSTEFRTAAGPETRAQRTSRRAVAGMERGMGAVMVVHSLHGLAQTTQDAGSDRATLPQTGLQLGRDAAGVYMGVRMIAARPVGPAFVLYVMLDLASVAAADHATSEDRDVALAGSTIRHGVGAVCALAGGAVMQAAPAAGHPVLIALMLGLGAAIMFGGPLLLDLLGLDGYVQDWFSFPPAEVTRLQRRIRELVDQYEVMIGARSLASRSDDELRTLGEDNPAQVRRDARDVQTDQRWSADELEGEIMTLFEEAYPEARTDWVGLRTLDVEADRFARLRQRARGRGPGGSGSGTEDRMEERFRRIQLGLDMSGMGAQEVRDLPQWKELDDRLNDDLEDDLDDAAGDTDWSDLAEEIREVEWMIESARYRLQPASQGGFRTTPLFRPGPARTAYEAELAKRERRFASIIARLQEMGRGGHAAREGTTDMAASSSTAPSAVLLRLLEIRDQEESLIAEGRRLFPSLRGVAAWGDPQRLAAQLRSAHASNPALFQRIRANELALGLATSQARYAQTQLGPTDALRPRFVRALNDVRGLVERRRISAGLVLPHELSSTLSEQTRTHHQELSTRYFGADPGTRPLSAEEMQALSVGPLRESGATISSPSRQLDAALDDSQRGLGGEWISVARLNPVVYVYNEDGRAPQRRTITQRNALVALASPVRRVNWERSTIERGQSGVVRVHPINQEAVGALGGRGAVSLVVEQRGLGSSLTAVRRTDLPDRGPPPASTPADD